MEINAGVMKPEETRESIINRRRYRRNIKGDKFSLYISNYPIIAEYLKSRIGDDKKVLVELCCGVGVTLEVLGGAFRRLVGVDNDRKVLSFCLKNLEDAGLENKLTLICGDVNEEDTLKKISADIALYDIPFWSPHEYNGKGDLTKHNPPLKDLVEKIRNLITEEIVISCSPQYDYETVLGEVGDCEYQKVFVNGKYNRNHVYLGRLIQTKGITKIELDA